MNAQTIVTLHRYFIWANGVRTIFDSLLEKEAGQDLKERKKWNIEMTMYMSLWYGLLYTVIEGWEQLKLSDKVIDQLLASNNKDLLRRYRNGVFHFQEDYNDERFEKFFQEKTTVEWIRSLNKEFGRWFLEQLKTNK